MANDVDPEIQEQINEALKKRIGFQEKNLELLEDEKTALNSIIDGESAAIVKTEARKMLLETMREMNRREIADLKERIKLGETLNDTEAKRLNFLNRQNKIAEGAPDFIKNMFSGKGAEVVKAGIGKIGDSIEGKITQKLQSAVYSGNNLGASFKGAFGPGMALAVFTMAKEMANLALELYNTENAFMLNTGASREFASSITNSFRETRKFGGSAEDVSRSMTSLFNGFTDFTFQSQKTREGLAKTATVLEKFGVSSDVFAQSIQNMTKAMGMSADAAGQQMLNLEKFAEELGVAPSKLASDFAGAGGQLAKFGDNGVDAFKDLAIASKATGIEIQRLLNITSAFDTFEGAATQAGKLNAALGGNFVNAMDLMMETDPTARFEQIRDAISDAGLSFDEMSYYQKNFYKEALGLQDVGELALFMSGNMDAVSGEVNKTSQQFEEAAKRAETLQSFQDQLNTAFAAMTPILTPIIRLFTAMAQALVPLADMLSFMADQVDKLHIGMAVTTHSPTFMDSLGIINEEFEGLGGNVRNAGSSMRSMPSTIASTPIPGAASNVVSSNGGGQSSGMQTVRQPMEISLNGDKLEKFIVQVTGKFIKDVSLIR